MSRKAAALAILASAILVLAAWQAAGIGPPSLEDLRAPAGQGAKSGTTVADNGQTAGETAAREAEPTAPKESPVATALRGWRDLQSFEATVLISGTNGQGSTTTQARLWFRRPNHFRLQTIGAPDGEMEEGTTVVFDGQRLAAYLPSEQRVVAVDGPARALLVAEVSPLAPLPILQLVELPSALDALATREDALLTTEPAEDGQVLDVVAVGAEQGATMGPGHVWLSKESGLPLRVRFASPDGELRFEVYFTEVFADFAAPEDMFSLHAPEGVQVHELDGRRMGTDLGWRQVTLAEVQAADSSSLLGSAGLLAGVEAGRAWAFGTGASQREIVQLSVDGGEAFLVVADAGLASPHLPGEAAQLAGGAEAEVVGVEGASSLVWTQGGKRLTLVGQMSRERALEVAAAIAGSRRQ